MIITRADRLGKHYTERPLAEFLAPSPPQELDLDRFSDLPREALLTRMLQHRRWRHHQGIEELKNDELYQAYVRRTDEMLEMIHAALVKNDLMASLASSRVADLAASEGFVTTRLLDWGAEAVDAFELSDVGIERFQLVWQYLNYAGQSDSKLYKLDFEQANWAAQLPANYEIIFCLGIIYHLENPMLFARNLFEATKEVCIIESDTPKFAKPNRFRGNGVIYLNKDQVAITEDNPRYLLEFRPDREALIDLLLTVGFSSVEVLEPTRVSNSYYARGEKSILLCRR